MNEQGERLIETVRSGIIGDDRVIDGPYGMAYLRDDVERDIVCIAGGSGRWIGARPAAGAVATQRREQSTQPRQ